MFVSFVSFFSERMAPATVVGCVVEHCASPLFHAVEFGFLTPLSKKNRTNGTNF